jgi:hypothetical protein
MEECNMRTRKDKTGKKKEKMRTLPKRKKDMTEAQAKNVKGGTVMGTDHDPSRAFLT